MSCPTCGKTLAGLGEGKFHCETCGTIVCDRGNGWKDIYVPKLVERCRDFTSVAIYFGCVTEWHKSGIAESINLPGERTP